MGRCMGGAWVYGGVLWGWGKCMCILPGLVRLELGVGGGLDGVGEEVVSS